MNTKKIFCIFFQKQLSKQDSNKGEQGGKFPQNSFQRASSFNRDLRLFTVKLVVMSFNTHDSKQMVRNSNKEFRIKEQIFSDSLPVVYIFFLQDRLKCLFSLPQFCQKRFNLSAESFAYNHATFSIISDPTELSTLKKYHGST